MNYRRLGSTGLEVSRIGFGCNRLADASRDRREVVATIEAALDHGINYFDTADRYGFGVCESLLGEVLRDRRDRVVLCSKAGKRYGPLERLRDRLRPYAQRLRKRSSRADEAVTALAMARPLQRFDPSYITQSVERSLRRLHSDYLDVFLFHNPSPEVVAEGVLFDLGDKLRRRGLIRHFGVACGSELLEHGQALDRLLTAPGLALLQMRVNPTSARTIADVLPRAADRDLPVVAFEPLGKGSVLADARFDALLTRRPDQTRAQLALRFALDQPAVSLVLVGMTRRQHLIENVAALRVPELTASELAALSA